MKIVLHDATPRQLFSLLCALFTGGNISHASVIHNGYIYDTTLSRGYMSRSKSYPTEQLDRLVTVYDVDLDDEIVNNVLQRLMGKKYNTLGLLTFPLTKMHLPINGRKDHFYCFQIVSEILKETTDYPESNTTSGYDLTMYLTKMMNLTGRRMRTEQLLHELNSNK